MYLSFSQLQYWETTKIQLQLLSLWVEKKKLQKVHKIVKFILCIYTGTRSFLHCTLTPTLQNYAHHNLSYKKRRGRGISIFFVIRTWRCVSTVHPTGVNRKFLTVIQCSLISAWAVQTENDRATIQEAAGHGTKNSWWEITSGLKKLSAQL